MRKVRANSVDFVLLKWRSKRGWTREEAAAKLGVSRRTLQEWEQGRRMPSPMAQQGVFTTTQEIEQTDNKTQKEKRI